MGVSRSNWYSIEAGGELYPEILAIPYEVLRHWTQERLPAVLPDAHIKFNGMDEDELEVWSQYIVDKGFERAIDRFRRRRTSFKIGEVSRRVVMVEVHEEDDYFLEDNPRPSTVKMVILGTYGTQETDAAEAWDALKKKGRPVDRRFTGKTCPLPAGFLKGIVIP
jgi:hypothetical protein